MRILCVLSFTLLAMTACSTGFYERDFDPETAAVERSLPYTGRLPNATTGANTTRCPNAFPTGGTSESDHAGVGQFFCEY